MIDAGKLFLITWGQLYGNDHYRADFSSLRKISVIQEDTITGY
jgi:hypothetical protein